MGKLFGTDGVRGKVNSELTVEMAMMLGKMTTIYFGKEKAQPIFLVGRDTRISGQMLAAALSAGVCSAGGVVMDLGVVPTPAVAYLTKKIGATAGVMISASHNPFYDNGIKFFAGDGYKLTDVIEEEIENGLKSDHFFDLKTADEKVGVILQKHELIEDYIDFLAKTVKNNFNGMKVVLDCSNGASFEVAPRLLKRLGADVKVIFDEPNGININEGCGSTNLKKLKEEVLRWGADIGIANDGDADRCLAVDEKGEEIDGDRIMLACAEQMMKEGRLKDNKLVITVMSNLGMHQAFEKMGGKLEITNVGDRYVLERMRANNYSLGGEQSGHVIFGEFSTTGDGVLTAIQLLDVLKASGRKASDLRQKMTDYPQLLINIKVKSKNGWQENKNILNVIKETESKIGKKGRILVRASGTEPLIRVMGEAQDKDFLRENLEVIVKVIKEELGEE